MKIITIVGTRPEIIKLSLTIQEIDKHINQVLVHTGQNYDFELNEIFFKELNIRKPDYFLNSVGKNVAETIGNIIAKSDVVMEKEKPDAMLVYGDTNSCLSVISAKKRKIPIFHMEAGNRCFDQRVPEEVNRKIVDHISDVNMTITEHARRYLIQEGLRPELIFKIGSSMKEVITNHKNSIESSRILKQLSLSKKSYFVVSCHREENVDSDTNLKNFILSLNMIAEKYKLPIIFSTHPRTKIRIDQNNIKMSKLVQLHKPFGFFDYLTLQKNAICVLSDSGTITEESSILSFPAVMIRNSHERPEGMDEGTVIMSGLKPENVFQAVKVTTDNFKGHNYPNKVVPDYDVDNVSKKVVNIILSYTDYIKREVWKTNS